MKRSYKLDGLCCAACAEKIQNDISKLDGVNSAKVVFMTEKLILDVEDGRMDEILDAAQKVVSRYEDDCVIVR